MKNEKEVLLCSILAYYFEKMTENSSSAQHITRRDSVVEKDLNETLNDIDDDFNFEVEGVEESEEEVENEENKKGRGMAIQYELVTETEDYASALQYMKDSMSDYTRRYFRDTLEGRKDYYRCKGFLKCQKLMCIHLHDDSQMCTIYQSTEEHTHESPQAKIPQAIVDLVNECLADKVVSNKRILEKCRERHLPQITVKQLNNLKSRLKTKKFGKAQNDLKTLIQWCEVEYQYNEFIEECVLSDTESESFLYYFNSL